MTSTNFAATLLACLLSTRFAYGTAPVASGTPPGASFQVKGPCDSVVSSSPDGNGVVVNMNCAGLPATGGPFHYYIANGTCPTASAMLDPYKDGGKTCDMGKPQTCAVGDLSGKHGAINRTSGQSSYNDPYVSTVCGSNATVCGRSLIVNYANGTLLSCANYLQAAGGSGAAPMNSSTPVPSILTTTREATNIAAGPVSTVIVAGNGSALSDQPSTTTTAQATIWTTAAASLVTVVVPTVGYALPGHNNTVTVTTTATRNDTVPASAVSTLQILPSNTSAVATNATTAGRANLLVVTVPATNAAGQTITTTMTIPPNSPDSERGDHDQLCRPASVFSGIDRDIFAKCHLIGPQYHVGHVYFVTITQLSPSVQTILSTVTSIIQAAASPLTLTVTPQVSTVSQVAAQTSTATMSQPVIISSIQTTASPSVVTITSTPPALVQVVATVSLPVTSLITSVIQPSPVTSIFTAAAVVNTILSTTVTAIGGQTLLAVSVPGAANVNVAVPSISLPAATLIGFVNGHGQTTRTSTIQRGSSTRASTTKTKFISVSLPKKTVMATRTTQSMTTVKTKEVTKPTMKLATTKVTATVKPAAKATKVATKVVTVTPQPVAKSTKLTTKLVTFRPPKTAKVAPPKTPKPAAKTTKVVATKTLKPAAQTTKVTTKKVTAHPKPTTKKITTQQVKVTKTVQPKKEAAVTMQA
ncbi:Cu,Zn superoxide dismutase-like protein [Teratosphaeria destructans]|uniref:Cu,Zn superoxide dismutase-like protein n=1 Tax=Teratosphaeria destructans TaxID=418781 RepID=A0A9W7T1C2_9PEZI|nr:Cu,Zn superoxide dismutase-like protein [Teratosphaeria destructans]